MVKLAIASLTCLVVCFPSSEHQRFLSSKEISFGTSSSCISDPRIIKRHGQSIIDEWKLQLCMQVQSMLPTFPQRSTFRCNGKGKFKSKWGVRKTTTWWLEINIRWACVAIGKWFFFSWTLFGWGIKGLWVYTYIQNECGGEFTRLWNCYV